jgi:hypothetical protein
MTKPTRLSSTDRLAALLHEQRRHAGVKGNSSSTLHVVMWKAGRAVRPEEEEEKEEALTTM